MLSTRAWLAVVLIALPRAAHADCTEEERQKLSHLEQDLMAQRSSLMQRKQAVTNAIEAFNRECAGATTEGCRARQGAVAGDQQAINAKIAAWRTEWDAFSKRKQGCPAPAPAQKEICANVDASTRRMVAARIEQRKRFQEGLKSRIAALQRARKDATEYLRQSETARAEASKNILADVLSTIPAEQVLQGAAKSKQLANALTEQRIGRIMTAYHGVQDYLASSEMIHEPKASSGVEAFSRALETMTDIPLAKLPDDVQGRAFKKYFDGMVRVFEVSGRLVGYWEGTNTKRPRGLAGWEPELRTLGDSIVILADWPSLGIVAPEVAAPIVFAWGAEKLAEKGAVWWKAHEATAQFGDVISHEWKAEQFLQKKLTDVSNELERLDLIAHCP